MPSCIKLSAPATREFWEIEVLAQDESFLALNKPAGLLVSPDRYDPERPNLMKLLHRDIARNAPWVREMGVSYLANAHRLDFETTGVILLAKTKPALVHFANLFGIEKPAKEYVALVQGSHKQERFTVNAKIGPHPARPGWMRIDPKGGKKSITQFEVAERFIGYSWMLCRPLTGRTHQIRIHLAHSGLPISGDGKYGGRPLLLSKLKKGYRLKPGQTERPLISTVALHAAKLTIEHPVSREPVVIEAPIPKSLQVALKYLRLYATRPSFANTDPDGSVIGEQTDQADGHDQGSQEQEPA